MAQLKSTSVTGNLSVTGNIVASNKIIQGAYNANATINEMNQLNTDLFISGNGSAPDKPTIPGIYLGKSRVDENRHIDIVSAYTPEQDVNNTSGYIDFSKAGTSEEDYRVRLIANVDTGLTQFQWNNALTNKTLKLDGGTLEAENIKVTSANFGSNEYGKIYVGTNDNIIKYREPWQFIQDLGLSQVYNYQGTLTYNEWIALTNIEVGDVYYITDVPDAFSDALKNLYNQKNVACKKRIENTPITAEATWGTAMAQVLGEYWGSLGNYVDLSGYVTKDTDQTITSIKTFSAQPRISTADGIKFTNGNCSLRIYNAIADRDYAAIEVRSNSEATHRNLFIDLKNNSLVVGTAKDTADTTYKVKIEGSLGVVGGLANITNNDNTLTLGSQDSSFCHIQNSQNIPFIFNNHVAAMGSSSTALVNLGIPAYPWNNILLKGTLQFYQGAGANNLRTEFKYNADDKCIDIIFH